MRSVALLYHDVVAHGRDNDSGFPGAGPARYKLEQDAFDRHLRLLHDAIASPPARTVDRDGHGLAWLLTFDDGGSSARFIGEKLSSYGWCGHFFIATDQIGQPGFVTKDDLRALRGLGHIIGSHSCSHPDRMSHCKWEELLYEWEKSVEVLSDILDEDVVTGSVPGGYYAKRVAEAAAAVGIKVLFTSEPVTRPQVVEGCLVVGRFALQRESPPELATSLVLRRLPRLRQFVSWNARKAVKSVGGNAYLRARSTILSRRSTS